MCLKRIAFLSIVVYMRAQDTIPCKESKQTVAEVVSCPRNEKEWIQRSELKQCSLSLCEGKSVNHCVINGFANGTLEVCAPPSEILGSRCVEYNFVGAVIQDSHYVKCNGSCPFKYNSTKAYRYQECFERIYHDKESRYTHTAEVPKPITSRSTEGLNSSTERICAENISCNSSGEGSWKIIAIVFIITAILFASIILWITLKKRMTSCYNYQKQGDVPEVESPSEETEVKTTVQELVSLMDDTEVQTTDIGRYVAALDLGDTYLNMAFSDAYSPEEVKPLGPFERMFFMINPKTNTTYFGYGELQQYKKEGNTMEKPHFIKLYDDTMDTDTYNTALSCIMKRAEDEMFKKVPCVKNSDIHYVFVVPNNWDKNALVRLENRLSKIDETKNNKRCVIKRELALPPFLHEVKARVVCLNFNVDNFEFQRESENISYAILHVGSSHLDLKFVNLEKKEKERKQNNTDSSMTIPWQKNSTPIECVLNFFEGIYGEKNIEKWKESMGYIDFLNRCEELIEEIDEHASHDKDYNLTLSEELVNEDNEKEIPKDECNIKLLTKDKKQCIEEKIKDNKEISLGDNNWTFKVSFKWIKSHFGGIKSQVDANLKRWWKDSENETVKYVVLTGTYSKPKIIWNTAEKLWFKDRNVTIVVPSNTHVFAMGGAYYGQGNKWLDDKK